MWPLLSSSAKEVCRCMGEIKVFGSPQNENFLGLLELSAQFDNFLADHIRRFGNSGKGVPSYLSSTTCNEFEQLMAKEVTSEISNEVKKAKYYSITVDSTPGVAHVDQLPLSSRMCRTTALSWKGF